MRFLGKDPVYFRWLAREAMFENYKNIGIAIRKLRSKFDGTLLKKQNLSALWSYYKNSKFQNEKRNRFEDSLSPKFIIWTYRICDLNRIILLETQQMKQRIIRKTMFQNLIFWEEANRATIFYYLNVSYFVWFFF